VRSTGCNGWSGCVGPVSRRAPLTTDRAAERTALLTYAVEDAGVPTPRLRALFRAGPEALVLATEEPHGKLPWLIWPRR